MLAQNQRPDFTLNKTVLLRHQIYSIARHHQYNTHHYVQVCQLTTQ
ncbi:hypothetical protein DSUL_40057 [Desulfovibrionales bacterium]